jgi:hypothetical protein
VPNPAARRRRREARNAEILGDVEERAREVNDYFGVELAELAHQLHFVCECGRTDCSEVVRLSADNYVRVRTWDSRLFVVPGHEDLDEEKVVERHDRWLVVQTLEPFRPEPPEERRRPGRPWSQG